MKETLKTANIFAWGANSHGQLGLGFESELVAEPQQIPASTYPFNANQIKLICGGGGHVLILDNYGRVYSCGWNNRGQLGLDSMENGINEFKGIPPEFFNDTAVESIACGWDISGAITTQKKLFVWGSNSFQQLGICQRGFTAVRRPFPVIMPRQESVLRVTFGMRHCAILTENHVVYVFGRLRLNDPAPSEICVTATTLNRADVLKIKPNNENELKILSISSGQNHLLLLTAELSIGPTPRRIIALGDNKYGQSNCFDFEDDIRQVAVGWTHNAVLLKNSTIYLWGRNCFGQLGAGIKSDSKQTPEELYLPKEAEPARLHSGAEHCLLRTKSGAIYTWGWNEHGNCGNKSTENLLMPTLIPLGNSKLAGAGAGFCYAICES